ncbi:MAG: PAS domain S-box protein [Deltaproteobacteria bacterium]|nr:MAG: PAS domain S-box protein [Deltaproteobacteria bacterium]
MTKKKVPLTKTFKFRILLLGGVGWVLPLITLIIGIGFFSRHLQGDLDRSLKNIEAREGRRLHEEQDSVMSAQLRQKVLDVAQELSLFLSLHQSRNWKEIYHDQEFRQIAVQQVGTIGETFLLNMLDSEILLSCGIFIEKGKVEINGQCEKICQALESLGVNKNWTAKLGEIKLPKTRSTHYYGFLAPVSVRPWGGPPLAVGVLADLKQVSREDSAGSSILKTAVNLSRSLVDTRISQFQREAFVFFGGLGLVGLLACLALMRRQTRAVAALTRAAEAYNDGDLDYRNPDPDQDELGHLAHTLNLMATNLQENTVSRAEWENTFNVIPDQVMILNTEQQIIRVNRAVAEYLGVSPEEVTGRCCYELMHNANAPAVSCCFLQAIREGIRTQTEYCSLDNRATFLVTVDPLRDREGKIVGAVHVARDITTLKQAQEELAQSSYFLKEIIESAPLAVAVVNAQGLYTQVNRQFLTEYGYAPEDILHKPYYLIYADRKERLQLMRELQEHGEALGWLVYVKHKDGRAVPTRISIRNLWGPGGELLGSVAMGRNISDEVTLQKQMEQVQKLEAVATLSGGLAHNFNNLLTVIMGLTNLMMAKVGPAHPFYTDLKEIELQVRAGRELTENLLTFTQDSRFEMQSLALNELIKGTVDLFARTHPDIEMALDLAPDLSPVKADPGLMQQVLMNLLINSWQAMSHGGRIVIQTRGVTVAGWQDPVWHLEPGPYASFAITDNGEGMDPKTLERIFEPLFTTKPLGQGTGLGLASVYHITKLHRGAILVDSQKGQGATFTIYLPVSPSKPQVIKPQESNLVYGRGTILVVDDEPVLRQVAARLLEKLGYRVIQAADGKMALEIFREQGPEIDLVLMDMIMPGMDGFQAVQKLRTLSSEVPIMLCSGYGDGKAKALPPDVGYLAKPYTLEVLSQKVAAALVRQ